VHGGPLIPAIAESVVEMLDGLGSQALEWVIDGLAGEKALPEVFNDRRRRFIDTIDRMFESGTPQMELSELLKLP